MKKDNLSIRMKNYEFNSKYFLMKRTPIAIRIDGKNFHNFTKGMDSPFDEILIETMQQTMAYLCKNIQGCVLGYCQSDEITLILIDYKNLDTSPWFNNKIQKISSISASMATLEFNRVFAKKVSFWNHQNIYYKDNDYINDKQKELYNSYIRALAKGALFDSRCFNIPKEEVTNLIYWRQRDAIRNSIQSLGLKYFSNKQILNKNSGEIKSMLLDKYNVDWHDLPSTFKWGSCCIKTEDNNWVIDNEIPVFLGDNRKYVDKLVDI